MLETLFNKVAGHRPATLLKRDSNTDHNIRSQLGKRNIKSSLSTHLKHYFRSNIKAFTKINKTVQKNYFVLGQRKISLPGFGKSLLSI